MKRLLVVPLFLVALAASSAGAEFLEGRYIVELKAEPALAPAEGGKGTRQASSDRLAAIRSQQDRVRSAVADRGLQVVGSVENVANVLIVEGGEADVAALAALPQVRRVRPVRLFKKLLDRAAILQRAVDAWALVGGVENAGRGVKIGIIDTGIDVMHPGLQDPDSVVPDGFPKVNNTSDVANTNGKVIVARNYDTESLASARDSEGHGTGAAMIAAGRTAFGSMGVISGIAPKAYLGSYKVFPDGEEGAPEDYVLKAIDDAVLDGMDIVNMSLGSFPAERPDQDLIVQAVERASAAGVIVVVAAGNEGPDLNSIGSPATAPSAVSVGNAYTDRIFATVVTFGDSPAYVAVPGNGPNSSARITGLMRDVAELDQNGLACSELPPDSLVGRIALILRGSCLFETKLRNAEMAGAIAAVVYTHAEEPSPGAMGVGSAPLPAVMIGNADGLDLKKRLQADPGGQATVNFSPTAVFVDSGRLSNSTSRGPSVDGAIKPELVAVGTSVYTATSGTQGNPRFQVSSGTSFSAPMVAGALALVKAARPGLTAQQYKSLVINSAASFPGTASQPGPVQQTGTGLLNVEAAVKSTIGVAPQVLSFGTASGTAELTRSLTLTNLGSDTDTFTFSVQGLAGETMPEVMLPEVQLGPGNSQQVEVRFAPRSTRDFYGFVAVRNSSGNVEVRVPYWFAVASTTASNITVIDGNPSSRDLAGSRQIFFIRPIDAAGVPVEREPSVTVLVGDGIVSSVRPSTVYPGFYRLEVRLGSIPGDNVFLLESAGASRRVTVTGQ